MPTCFGRVRHRPSSSVLMLFARSSSSGVHGPFIIPTLLQHGVDFAPPPPLLPAASSAPPASDELEGDFRTYYG
ncbi:hypothetical protein V2J09_018316 [Rumex salicifolius]